MHLTIKSSLLEIPVCVLKHTLTLTFTYRSLEATVAKITCLTIRVRKGGKWSWKTKLWQETLTDIIKWTWGKILQTCKTKRDRRRDEGWVTWTGPAQALWSSGCSLDRWRRWTNGRKNDTEPCEWQWGRNRRIVGSRGSREKSEFCETDGSKP